MISIERGIKDMTEKNICQNPKCFENHTKDRWNKKIGRYQSRKAYHKPRIKSEYYHWVILEYFCTTSCANSWLNDNLENIIERKHCPNKILEKQNGITREQGLVDFPQ